MADSKMCLDAAQKAYPNDENLRVAYMLGVDKGYEFCREDMLKDAVEGKVVENYGCEKGEDGEWRGVITPTIRIEAADFSIGDKVKIIIVKEDEVCED